MEPTGKVATVPAVIAWPTAFVTMWMECVRLDVMQDIRGTCAKSVRRSNQNVCTVCKCSLKTPSTQEPLIAIFNLQRSIRKASIYNLCSDLKKRDTTKAKCESLSIRYDPPPPELSIRDIYYKDISIRENCLVGTVNNVVKNKEHHWLRKGIGYYIEPTFLTLCMVI